MPIAIQTNQDPSGQRDLSGEQTGQDTSDTSGQDGGQDNSGQAMLVDNNTPSDPLIED